MLKVDLHCHTNFSYDSNIDPIELIKKCKEKGIDHLAITDHNVIGGAEKMKKLAPELIIVGEEISTTAGDIIGLFLTEWIPSRLSPEETIERIRAQKGLVYIPHAFDQFRAGIGLKVLNRIRNQIDIIEVFNSKTFVPAFDKKAYEYAMQYKLPMAAGSDTHQLNSLGNAYNEIGEFKTPLELREQLKKGKRIEKRTGLGVYLSSGLTAMKSYLKKDTVDHE
jgi:predicted metal-dependent phosphoesterase TrpH